MAAQTQTEWESTPNEKEDVLGKKKEYIFQSCMELGSFPIQFPIHNGLACLCAKAQTKLFFMSIRDNCVRRWLSVALT